MSINGLDFDPVGGINTAVDVFARAGPVSAMPGMAGRMALKVEVSVRSVQFNSVRPFCEREPTQGKSSVWG
jgi:hypothetical protein